MLKDNNYICQKCKEVNPKFIMIEKWNKGDSQPYRIDILLLENEDNKNFYYKIEKINLSKKRGKSLLHHTCGKCQCSIRVVNEENCFEFMRELNDGRRK